MKMKMAAAVGSAGTDLLSESLRLSEGVPEPMKKGNFKIIKSNKKNFYVIIPICRLLENYILLLVKESAIDSECEAKRLCLL